jgi:hypothetical protein
MLDIMLQTPHPGAERRPNRRLPGGRKERGRWICCVAIHESNNRTEPNDVTDLERLTCMDPHAVDGGSGSRTEILDGKLFVSRDQRSVNAADLRVV